MTDDNGATQRPDPDKVREFFRSTVAREWGIRLDERMKALGIKDADLAPLAGVTVQTIHQIRSGKIVPREHVRLMIAFSLLAEPADLFPQPTRARVLEAVA